MNHLGIQQGGLLRTRVGSEWQRGRSSHRKRLPSVRSSNFLRPFVALFFFTKERLLEQTINLAQYPEDRNKKNRDYEQQELNGHSISLLNA